MKGHFSATYEVVCKCGNKMVTDSGLTMSGLIVYTKGYSKTLNKIPVRYRGGNQNFICPSCGKTTEVFLGFYIKEDLQ